MSRCELRVAGTGDTWPVRGRLKELGGVWEGKCWYVPTENYQAALPEVRIYRAF